MKQYKVIGVVCICVPQRMKLASGTVMPEDFFEPDQLQDLLRRRFISEVIEPVVEPTIADAEKPNKKNK